MKAIGAALACLILGLGLGHLRGTSAPAERPARVETPRPSQVPVVREVVRREMVREHAEHAEPAEVAPPAADEQRIDRARLVVDRAKARGVWTTGDRDALRDEMAGLDGASNADLAAAFSDAVNRGELRLETDVPL